MATRRETVMFQVDSGVAMFVNKVASEDVVARGGQMCPPYRLADTYPDGYDNLEGLFDAFLWGGIRMFFRPNRL